ncbi:hypothetical protein LTR37_000847 [Vermiconidia calcicola]|uniref:Uncharacterized protein n=1 Tax=Vermiconidia calcicola TaxID=1690605 RepID=A0ACC3NZX6_9PEZI|nr:hypothetical protein LTR37_000847 [Vermiconidia calcicola]
MVLDKLIFSTSADSSPPAVKPTKYRNKREQKKFATPATPGHGTPPSAKAPSAGYAGISSPYQQERASSNMSPPGSPAQGTPDPIRSPATVYNGRLSREQAEQQQKKNAKQSRTTIPNPLGTPSGDDVVESIEADATAEAVEPEDDEGGTVLDPSNSPRQYWFDPITRLQREIWRPGDGDGDKAVDYFDKPGPPAPLEKRWRLYQSRTGTGPIKHNLNEPPKYVILDDATAHACLTSNIPRTFLPKWWGHDFGGAGIVRARRGHRGRGAIGDADAPGNEKYHFTKVGVKHERYYFTGEKDYKSIIYRIADPEAVKELFQPAKRGFPSPPPKKALPENRHGHNQFTPKDQMVKHGAPHKGVSWMRYRNRVNTFLPRDPSPEWRPRGGFSVLFSKDKEEATALPSSAVQYGTPFGGGTPQAGEVDEEEGESLWIGGDDDEGRPAKRARRGIGSSSLEPTGDDDGHEMEYASDVEFPFGTTSKDANMTTTTTPRPGMRRKQHTDFLTQMLDDQDVADKADKSKTETGQDMGGPDSGSYASQLEVRLASAKQTIEEQKAQIEQMSQLQSVYTQLQDAHAEAESMIKELEEENANLKLEVGGVGKSW